MLRERASVCLSGWWVGGCAFLSMNFVDRTGHPSMPELTWQYGYAYFCESGVDPQQPVSQGLRQRSD